MTENRMIVASGTPPRGWAYWVFIGWWWEPVKWAGRMFLWLSVFPLGIWRSIVTGRKRRERKMARRIEKAVRDE